MIVSTLVFTRAVHTGRGVGRGRRAKVKTLEGGPVREEADRRARPGQRGPGQRETIEEVATGDGKNEPEAPPPPGRSTPATTGMSVAAACMVRKDDVRRPRRRMP